MHTFLFAAPSPLLIGLTASAEGKKDEKIDGAKVLGKWRLKDDKDGAMVMEFDKGGKLTTTVTFEGKEIQRTVVEYKVEGATLLATDRGQTTKSAILRLTDAELVARKRGGARTTSCSSASRTRSDRRTDLQRGTSPGVTEARVGVKRDRAECR